MILTAAFLAIFLVLFVLPVERYRPFCGVHFDLPLDLEGPLRPEFADYMEEEFKENGFFYLRIGNHLFVRLLYPLKWRGKRGDFDSLNDLAINTENKSYTYIYDADPSSGRPLPPAAIPRIIVEGKEFIRRYDTRREEAPGKVYYAWQNTAYACCHKYAYVIEVESVPPEQRMQFLNADIGNRPPR